MRSAAELETIEKAARALGVILLNNGWAGDWDESGYEDRETLLIDAEAILVASGLIPEPEEANR